MKTKPFTAVNPATVDFDEIDSLINYAVKNGYADDSAEDWTDEEKLAYYQKCDSLS